MTIRYHFGMQNNPNLLKGLPAIVQNLVMFWAAFQAISVANLGAEAAQGMQDGFQSNVQNAKMAKRFILRNPEKPLMLKLLPKTDEERRRVSY